MNLSAEKLVLNPHFLHPDLEKWLEEYHDQRQTAVTSPSTANGAEPPAPALSVVRAWVKVKLKFLKKVVFLRTIAKRLITAVNG